MLQGFARLVSIVFHPLLILTYMLVLLLLVNPYSFGFHNIVEAGSRLLILRVFLSSFFIPGTAVAMLRFTGLLRSLDMPRKEDRIGPYIIAGIFYTWLFRNILDNTQIPALYTSFVLGATIALFLSFLINIFSKISIHTVGMGGLLGMILITMTVYPDYSAVLLREPEMISWQVSMSLVLIVGVLIAGLVGTCRLILKAHEPIDLLGGYLVGFASQFIAMQFVG